MKFLSLATLGLILFSNMAFSESPGFQSVNYQPSAPSSSSYNRSEDARWAASNYRNCIDYNNPYRKGQCHSILVNCDAYRAGDRSVSGVWCQFAAKINANDIEPRVTLEPVKCTRSTFCYKYFDGGHCGKFALNSRGNDTDRLIAYIHQYRLCEVGPNLCHDCAR